MIDPASAIPWTAIAAGGATGAVLRGLLARFATAPDRSTEARFDPAFATLAVNLVACALLGAWTASAQARPPEGADGLAAALSAFVTTGLCGSLSTFSTLCSDGIRLGKASPDRHGSKRAAAYLIAHLAGGPLALAAGTWLGR